ncbi:hypothetical protein RirG_146360 [Rhizophagus irregularis DAOM 197198w]|uniref:DUF8211 domain-containing protein n=1 Tax=Rhizophagus irregularis (strain DAOM 197198w) TaxID=1432141 RepID=A0A015KVM3_RHIIW|nr:hypothetical protein RirG_146360 [Rhizophagus irregularis DAOM 197198w]
MYHKLLYSFQFTPSSNPRTATKQKQRFERSVRRVLKDENINPGGTSSTSTKLAAARKRKFLFLDSQKLRPRVKHLHYKKSGLIPDQDDYNARILLMIVQN